MKKREETASDFYSDPYRYLSAPSQPFTDIQRMTLPGRVLSVEGLGSAWKHPTALVDPKRTVIILQSHSNSAID